MKREFSGRRKNWNVELITKFLIFVLMLLIFIKSFFWGGKGFLFYKQMQKDITQDVNKVNNIKTEIVQLKTDIYQWKNNDFMIEKMAREELQMALPSEKVYILNKQ